MVFHHLNLPLCHIHYQRVPCSVNNLLTFANLLYKRNFPQQKSNKSCLVSVLTRSGCPKITFKSKKNVLLSLLSFMPMSPCLTMWDLLVSLLSWSMRMITAPSSASRCTTSASLRTHLLAPHCFVSWWVPQSRDADDYVWDSCDLPWRRNVSVFHTDDVSTTTF